MSRIKDYESVTTLDSDAMLIVDGETNGTKAIGVQSLAEDLNSRARVTAGRYPSSAIGDGATCEGQNTTASNKYSHAEGYYTTASGTGSHAEGYISTSYITNSASGDGSHAEGYGGAYASGEGSHAEGYGGAYGFRYASGKGAHAEGYASSGYGRGQSASGDGAHVEGYFSNDTGHGSYTLNKIASGTGAHAEGYGALVASGTGAHAEGYNGALASGDGAHVEGYSSSNPTGSNNTIDESTYTRKATGNGAHAEGCDTTASGYGAHAEGSNTTASNNHSHAEGYYTTASAIGAHAEGYYTTATTSSSKYYGAHAEGYHTSSYGNQHVEGHYNKASSANGNTGSFSSPAHIIGNGTSATASNAFRVNYDGTVYGLSAFNSSGADYAEFIKPWADNNENEEDRVGYFVTCKEDGLHKAEPDDYIYGITSGNPSVIGNADEDYYWRYKRDEFNRFINTEITVEVEKVDEEGNIVYDLSTGTPLKHLVPDLSTGQPLRKPKVDDEGNPVYDEVTGQPEYENVTDEEGNVVIDENTYQFVEEDVTDDEGNIVIDESTCKPVMVEETVTTFAFADDYDSSKQQDYIERKDRKEWDYVGMVGVLPVRDDGTCIPHKFCKCGTGGIATLADERGYDTYMVIERISENVVSVLLK